MKQSFIRHLSFVLLVSMLLSVFATSCAWFDGNNGSGSSWQPPKDEYNIPVEDGYNQLTLYWKGGSGVNYNTCDIWIWYGDVAGRSYPMHECEYGAKVVINIPEDVESVGFIVRRDSSNIGETNWGNCVKDYELDREAIIQGKYTYIYLKTTDGAQYSSEDGGKTLTEIKLFSLAGMVDFNTIKYNLTPKTKLNSYRDVKVYDGDKELTVLHVDTMGKEATTGYITVEETLQLDKTYYVEIAGFEKVPVVPTDIFDSKLFADLYHYDGNDLGSYINGDSTTFKVWAPTASEVVLNLYESGHEGESYKDIKMTLGTKGVWEWTEKNAGHGTYYTYTVTTSVGTQVATDPYGKAAGANGNRSMVVDLSKTNPDGWDDDSFDPTKDGTVNFDSYSDAFIWEVHVRDFSNLIESSQYKGKYLAFTERGLVNEAGVPVGVDYLVNLGVTHVHLLPVYDYATVDETSSGDEFNWGYDPKNYNVPEGSYSMDPYNGEVRIKEYKQMVQALHDAGIGVIMDVVYNHTYDKNSSFNKIVPYYYYRYSATGANTSASGCGNDTASERYMYGKFMVDSTSYWMEEYHLDGLRFDLMGLHDLQTMQEVESAVHTINPNAIIYGEGWKMGSTTDGSKQANQWEIKAIEKTNNAIGAIAVFNDVIRDGLRGGNDGYDTSKGYINGNYNDKIGKIQFSIRGGTGTGGNGWTVRDGMIINYMSAHDNHTLWDKLAIANSSDSDSTRLAMNRLGAAILFISRGTPFVQAGEEMLRTKAYYDKNGNLKYDHNSYKSSDEVNNLKWETLEPGSNEYNMMMYYSGLAKMRKTYDIFSNLKTEMNFSSYGQVMIVTIKDHATGKEACVLINPTSLTPTAKLPDGNWDLVADGTRAGSDILATESGAVKVSPYSVRIYVR